MPPRPGRRSPPPLGWRLAAVVAIAMAAGAASAAGVVRLTASRVVPASFPTVVAPPVPAAVDLAPLPQAVGVVPAPPAETPGPPRPSVTVPVLMYHYVRVNPVASDQLGFNLSVKPADFDDQLDLLAAAGFTTVSMGDVLDAMDGRRSLPEHPVVLTFDDGYADFYTAALPRLHAHRMTATSYVVSGFVNTAGYMTASQVTALPAYGVTVGAHTVHHVDLTQVPSAVARAEITQSKHDLETLLQRPVPDFAYPAGKFSAAVEAAVEEAGFRDSVTTLPGTQHPSGARYAISRVRISGGTSITAFAEQLGLPAAAVPASILHRQGAHPAPAPLPDTAEQQIGQLP